MQLAHAQSYPDTIVLWRVPGLQQMSKGFISRSQLWCPKNICLLTGGIVSQSSCMPYCQHAPPSANRILIRQQVLDGEQCSYAVPALPLVSIKWRPRAMDHQNDLTLTPLGWEGTSYWPHLWEICHLASTFPTIDSLLLCIRSHACSDPKIIGSDQKQHLLRLLLRLSQKVKAVVFSLVQNVDSLERSERTSIIWWEPLQSPFLCVKTDNVSM